MNKAAKYTFNVMNQDISKYKHPGEFHYKSKNIRVNATDSQSTTASTNEKGTKLIITLPSPTIVNNEIRYNDEIISFSFDSELQKQLDNNDISNASGVQKFISHVNTRNGFVIFSTDDNGFDCIWEVEFDSNDEDNYILKLLYVRNLNFSTERIIDAIYNYENKNIQKIYWVDGLHQVRNLNIRHDSIKGNIDIINLSTSNLNFVGNVDFSRPIVESKQQGGSHTAGMIQYGYNLFNLNGSQTKISPLSELTDLGKGNSKGGGEVNEVVGITPVVSLSNLDTSYEYLRVYAIKYTSYNQSPSISLIDEREISSDNITIYDTGSIIQELTLTEFLFLGSDPITPKHIESKDNSLFLFNVKTKNFTLPDELDTRAYSFNSSGNCFVFDDVRLNPSGSVTGASSLRVTSPEFNVPPKFDAVNTNLDQFKYTSNGAFLGAEGKYLFLRVYNFPKEIGKYYKDGEIYRFGLVFYNKFGQKSEPQWICDYKMPRNNLKGNFNRVKISLKNEFYTWLNNYPFESESDRPVAVRPVRAVRTENDKTIIAQGIAGSMMINYPSSEKRPSDSDRRTKADNAVKIPNFLLRTNETLEPLQKYEHLQMMQFKNGNPNDQSSDDDTLNPLTELQHDSTQKRATTFQYNAMYQLYSPDIMFSNPNLVQGMKFKPVGFLNNTQNSSWYQQRNVENKKIENEIKSSNALTHFSNSADYDVIIGERGNVALRGLIANGNAGDQEHLTVFSQYYREYLDYEEHEGRDYTIYGSPEITERGQGRTLYNNNSKFEYNNSLEGVLTDGEDEYSGDNQDPITSVNSWGAKCATIVLGDNNDGALNRVKHDDIYSNFNKDGTMLYEIKLDDKQIYVSNIYGGNSYEDKKRTTYVETGDYTLIDNNSEADFGQGDTFVEEFSFVRINKTNTETYQYNIYQLSEIVKVKLETSIDLKNRNDISFSAWDSNFQPQYDEYHKYNNVYSQQENLLVSTDNSVTFRSVNEFDTRIQATKTKIPNEIIDSWTDILPNETMHLDGKYGPINGVVNFKDNIFTLQDKGVANIIINPRVQVQGQDDISLELGKGDKLYDYKYISTDSGTLNKHSIITSPMTFYYYDTLNKAICRFKGSNVEGISTTKGMHSAINNDVNTNIINKDNPLLKTGIASGYDLKNNMMYMSFLQDKNFTITFDEKRDGFSTYFDYIPSAYINNGERLISTTPDINKLHQHFKGDYNVFYGEYFPSSITLMVNPESDLDCVFNNIEYKSEVYLKDIDQPKDTITSIHAWNEYQDTDKIELVYGKNIRRKFRNWRAQIPRNKNSRDRIRNPYIFLKLEYNNDNNSKLILHDIIVHYTI